MHVVAAIANGADNPFFLVVATFRMHLSTAKLHLPRPKEGMVPRGSQDEVFFLY